MKSCIRCNTEKELMDFPKDKRQDDGRRNTCKKCRKPASFDEVEYGKQWKTANTPQWLWLSAKHRAKRTNREFNITPDHIIAVLPADMICCLTQTKMSYIEGSKGSSPSLDRIDNNIGYIPSNIQVISHSANAMKMTS